MVEREVTFSAESRLDKCESKGASISWPIPLDGLLDRLLVLCDEAAQRTSRKELAAAIVFAAPRNGEALAEMLMKYRRATVADVAPQGTEDENVIPFLIRRPGPRTGDPRM